MGKVEKRPDALTGGEPLRTLNELIGFACSVGQLWATPQHDRAGNATTIPQPLSPTDTFLCTYDAWNRLVRVVDGDGTGA